MSWQAKTIIGYSILILAIYGGGFAAAALLGVFVEPEIEPNEAIITKEYVQYDYVLENIHDVVNQKVSTTFHDYTVIIYKGQVVDKGVIHHYQCKCKKNGK